MKKNDMNQENGNRNGSGIAGGRAGSVRSVGTRARRSDTMPAGNGAGNGGADRKTVRNRQERAAAERQSGDRTGGMTRRRQGACRWKGRTRTGRRCWRPIRGYEGKACRDVVGDLVEEIHAAGIL